MTWARESGFFEGSRSLELTPEAIVGALRSGVRSYEGLLEVSKGAPAEWVVSFEQVVTWQQARESWLR